MAEAGVVARALFHRTGPAGRRSRTAAAAFVLLPLLCLAGCSLYPPPDAVKAQGGLEHVEERYGVRPLDPTSDVPLVKQALEEVEKTDLLRYYRGTTYRLTQGNLLPEQWLLQTPKAWGMRAADVPFFPIDCKNCDPDFRLPACEADADCGHGTCAPLAASGLLPRKFCVGQSDRFIDVFYGLIVSAERAVDIALLQPAADYRFLAAVRNAITRLAYSGRPVVIRVIVGDYPPAGFDVAAYLRELTRDARAVPNSLLHIYVGAIRSCNGEPPCGALSWNHAKIVAVDGKRAIVGGHNMWTPDYLADAPVHDISMEVEGPAAVDAHRFSDALWEFVCDQSVGRGINAAVDYAAGMPDIGAGCLPEIDLPRPGPAPGHVPILSVGRLGFGVATVFTAQSLVARDVILGAATRTIRMLQQDVAFAIQGVNPSWPDGALDKMAALIAEKHGDVFLILSNYGAAGKVGTYSNKVTLETLAQKIREVVRQRSGIAEPDLSALLCQRLHLAPLRFGPDSAWPDGRPIGTHAKFWMVDDRVFYIGSENLYPSELQEFGYIVEDKAAAAELRRAWWDEAWKWSRAAAISGDDAPTCIFSAPAAAAPRSDGAAKP